MCHQFLAAAVTHQRARNFTCSGLYSLSWKKSLEPLNMCQTHEIADREVKIFLFSPCFLSSRFSNQALMLEGNYSGAARVILKILGAVCEKDLQKI